MEDEYELMATKVHAMLEGYKSLDVNVSTVKRA